MAFFRETFEQYDAIVAAEDEIRLVAINNPTSIGNELVVLAGTMQADNAYDRARDIGLRAQRARSR